MNMRTSAIRAAFLLVVLFCLDPSVRAGNTLRIVDWNIEDDINGATTPLPGFNTVLQGIGNEIIAGGAQPIDILALEETTSNATTVQPILDDLNSDYPNANYQMSTVQGAVYQNILTNGDGPNAIVYNANTVTLLNSVGVGNPLGSNGLYRQVMRYEFQPVGGKSPFYIYVSHMKSGNATDLTSYNLTNAQCRGDEAAIIRSDEATLPANASVLYAGDLNASPPEAEYTNFGAAGQGQAFDPTNFSSSTKYLSESATNLRYRDDYQLMTQDILNGTGAINYVANSMESFGNNGTVAAMGQINSSSNTDLAYMTTANGYAVTQSDILNALTTASDHLPNVAEYTFVPLPEPSTALLIGGMMGLLLRRRA